MLGFLFALSRSAPAPQITLLPANLSAGLVVAQALSLRHSERNFASTPLPIQLISDLLWSVDGINRPASSLLTVPTAINAQDVSVYVVFPDGTYLFDNKANVLNLVYTGDLRNLVASVQPTIANAPLILLFVSDYSKFTGKDETEQKRLSALDVGIAVQTALVWAAANGYVTVPRAFMETDQLVAALKLKSTQILHLNVPIGKAP
jgi:nitroreductase